MTESKTGCSRLDRMGITNPDSQRAKEICLNCPLSKCKIDNPTDDLTGQYHIPVVEEHWVQCQVCGAKETLTFTDAMLDRTSHWSQKGDIIYHLRECGKAKII